MKSPSAVGQAGRKPKKLLPIPKLSRSPRRLSLQNPRLPKRRKSPRLNLPTRRRATLPPRTSPNQGEPAPDPGRRPRQKKRLRAKMRRQLPSRKLSLSKKKLLNRLLLPIKRLHRSKRIPRSRNRLLLKERKSKSLPDPRMLLMLPRKRVPASVKSATTTRVVVSANPVSRGAAIVRKAIEATARRTIVITTVVASTSKTVVSRWRRYACGLRRGGRA